MSLVIVELHKVKLLDHKGFTFSVGVSKKWIKSSLDIALNVFILRVTIVTTVFMQAWTLTHDSLLSWC
ncbi:hypothetical protein [Nostoc sp.]|uniref:hypothetical protein n=1 Tax=Nostoc sp. TaxID=1180 RepID=UPI002FF89F98